MPFAIQDVYANLFIPVVVKNLSSRGILVLVYYSPSQKTSRENYTYDVNIFLYGGIDFRSVIAIFQDG